MGTRGLFFISTAWDLQDFLPVVVVGSVVAHQVEEEAHQVEVALVVAEEAHQEVLGDEEGHQVAGEDSEVVVEETEDVVVEETEEVEEAEVDAVVVEDLVQADKL